MPDLGPLFDGEGIEFGHLQRELQRRQTAAAAKQQEVQNERLIALMEEQKAERERERQRLESLPKCPACLAPVEIGASRCGKCQISIVTWSNRSFQLICLAEEAPSRLAQRVAMLSEQATRLAQAALAEAQAYATILKTQLAPSCQALLASLNATRPEDRDSVTGVFENVLAGGSPLTPRQKLHFDDAIRQIHRENDGGIRTAQTARDSNASANPPGAWVSFLLQFVGWGAGILVCMYAFSVRIEPLRYDSLGMVANTAEELAQRSQAHRERYKCFGVAAILFAVGPFGGWEQGRQGRLHSQRLQDNQHALNAALAAREAAIAARNKEMAEAAVAWTLRLEKAGLASPLSTVKQGVGSANNARYRLNSLIKRLKETGDEINEIVQFGSVRGLDMGQTKLPALAGLDTLSGDNLSAVELFRSYRMRQLDALREDYDSAIRMARQLQALS